MQLFYLQNNVSLIGRQCCIPGFHDGIKHSYFYFQNTWEHKRNIISAMLSWEYCDSLLVFCVLPGWTSFLVTAWFCACVVWWCSFQCPVSCSVCLQKISSSAEVWFKACWTQQLVGLVHMETKYWYLEKL